MRPECRPLLRVTENGMARGVSVCTFREGGTPCPELAPPGQSRCPAHQPPAWSTSKRQKPDRTGWERQTRNRRTLKRHNHRCHLCGTGGCTIVDHVTPLAEGGTDTEPNRRPICADCHDRKTRTESNRARRTRG